MKVNRSNQKKENLEAIIASQGSCTTPHVLGCVRCPFKGLKIKNCPNPDNNQRRYNRAIKIYLRAFGREELFKVILPSSKPF